MNPSWLNAIITEEERKEVRLNLNAITFRLTLACVVCEQLPKIFDQRFGKAA